MTWKPTNTDDVTMIVSRVQRNESGARTGTTDIANTNAITVSDFSIDTEEDLERLSGVGNKTPLGISRGDVDHSFSFTVRGEDAELFQSIAEGDGEDETGTSTAVEIEIIVKLQDTRVTLSGAWAGTRSLSGSSGDPTEFEVEGMATDKQTEAL